MPVRGWICGRCFGWNEVGRSRCTGCGLIRRVKRRQLGEVATLRRHAALLPAGHLEWLARQEFVDGDDDPAGA